MSRYKIQYSSTALSDIKDIVRYIAQDLRNPVAAEKLYQLILSKVESLSSFPFSCPLYYSSGLKQEYRRLMVNNYAVFYWVDMNEEIIVVERIIYAGSVLI